MGATPRFNSSDSTTTELQTFTQERVRTYAVPQPTKPPKPEMPSGSFRRRDEADRLLLCEIAALNKELTALRQHMDWQAKQINDLEQRFITLGVK